MANYGAHPTHCCKWHGCKYGDPDCPVVTGKVKQVYLCEDCYEDIELEDYHRQAVENIKEIKRFIKERNNIRKAQAKDDAYKYLKDILGSEQYVRLSNDEFKKHIYIVRDILGSKLTSANSILHLVDGMFNCKQIRDDYIFYYGEEAPSLKRKSMKKSKENKSCKE